MSYISGQWNVICDSCGRKIKSGIAKQRWDGFIVCPDDYEMRHPQDFVKSKTDKISVPFTRPIPTEIYIAVNYNIYFDDNYIVADYITPN
jgi:hypothetical protein